MDIDLRTGAMQIRYFRNLLVCLVGMLLVVTLLCTVAVGAVTGQGSLQLSVSGYGEVQGMLQDATIYPNGTVSMIMSVNDQMQTSYGAIPVTATGLWNGVINGSEVSGSIQNVAGDAHICVVFLCGDANFIGQGEFTGSLNASHATGVFQGTITFTNSPVSQIPVGQPIPMSGSWSADFLTPVPEFGSDSVTFVSVFAAAIMLFSVSRKRRLQC